MYRTQSVEAQRSSLEIFILALISQGLTTTYALQTGAGLSLGATVPALSRLSKAKLVSKQVQGRRHEFSLTRAGEKALGEWRPPVGRPAREYDDLLRTACLSAFLQRDRAAATEMLRQAARARRRAAEDRADELRGRSLGREPLAAAAYLWMRLVAEQHRLSAEGKALELIAAEIEPRKACRTDAVRKRN